MSLPDAGLHSDIPEAEYHSDGRSLSSTGAKTLLYRGPRAYRWAQDHPVHKDAYDMGSVVHALVLGVGDYEVILADSWRTKSAQEEREAARSAGRTPILAKDFEAAAAMRDAVYASPLAAGILSEGRPEVSAWGTDPETGILMRGRLDWLRDETVVDLKTSAKPTHPCEFERTAWTLGYHLQAAWYLRLLELAGEEPRPYLWVVLDKNAPHETYVYQASADLLERGREDVDRALRLYADCLARDTWPGLADDQEIHQLDAPAWAR